MNIRNLYRHVSTRFWIKLTISLVVVIIALFSVVSLSKSAAPDVHWTNLTGERTALKDLRGSVVIVNFWATSCTTCVAKMPQLVDTYHQYKERGLKLVAIAMHYDPPNYVLNFAQTRNLPFDVALDTQDTLAKAFGDVKLTPTTLVIDQKGNIIKRYVGAPPFDTLHQWLEKELPGLTQQPT